MRPLGLVRDGAGGTYGQEGIPWRRSTPDEKQLAEARIVGWSETTLLGCSGGTVTWSRYQPISLSAFHMAVARSEVAMGSG